MKIKINDVVEVQTTILSGIQSHESWKAALVVAIHDDHDSFSVKALKGAFDDAGHQFMDLQFSARNRSWR